METIKIAELKPQSSNSAKGIIHQEVWEFILMNIIFGLFGITCGILLTI